MADKHKDKQQRAADVDPNRRAGEPGDGAGRRETVKGSGVYPASGPDAPDDAQFRTMHKFGQGERGKAGYDDHGESELGSFRPEQSDSEHSEPRGS